MFKRDSPKEISGGSALDENIRSRIPAPPNSRGNVCQTVRGGGFWGEPICESFKKLHLELPLFKFFLSLGTLPRGFDYFFYLVLQPPFLQRRFLPPQICMHSRAPASRFILALFEYESPGCKTVCCLRLDRYSCSVLPSPCRLLSSSCFHLDLYFLFQLIRDYQCVIVSQPLAL